MNPPKHIVSAAAIVVNDNQEILLIKGPRRGWEMPGGQVELGESLSQAAIRETKEESGIDIEIIKFCGIFQNIGTSTCNTLFLARQIGGELIQTNESLDSGFFPIDEALKKVEWKNFRQRIEYCLKPEIQPFCIEFSDENNF
jgi:8-oxo-dGTP diphosphatase